MKKPERYLNKILKELMELEAKRELLQQQAQIQALMYTGLSLDEAHKKLVADRYLDSLQRRSAKETVEADRLGQERIDLDKNALIEELLANRDQAPTTSSGQRLAMPATVLELLAGVGGGALIGALADDLLEEDSEPRQLNR